MFLKHERESIASGIYGVHCPVPAWGMSRIVSGRSGEEEAAPVRRGSIEVSVDCGVGSRHVTASLEVCIGSRGALIPSSVPYLAVYTVLGTVQGLYPTDMPHDISMRVSLEQC